MATYNCRFCGYKTEKASKPQSCNFCGKKDSMIEESSADELIEEA